MVLGLVVALDLIEGLTQGDFLSHVLWKVDRTRIVTLEHLDARVIHADCGMGSGISCRHEEGLDV